MLEFCLSPKTPQNLCRFGVAFSYVHINSFILYMEYINVLIFTYLYNRDIIYSII